MRNALLILLLTTPLFAFSQQETENTEDLAKERATILAMIDSLETRLNIINNTLQTPEERLEIMKARYGKNKGKMIAEHKVWASIDYRMAIDSWGEPLEKKVTESTSGTTERWNYSNGRYLFFKNGRLETWKE